jgi:competence protein ComEC
VDSGTPPSPGFDTLASHLGRMGWKFHATGGGQNLTYGDGARCEVVAPGVWSSVPRNQASLVLRFAYDTARALIPGDADSISESFQIAAGEALRSQILDVGHHGSKHSSSLAWLRLASPREAVLSYGKSNRYGHPHAEVLARLDSVGARVWRTPDGAVFARLSGSGAEVERASGAWWRGPWRRTDLSFPPSWI